MWWRRVRSWLAAPVAVLALCWPAWAADQPREPVTVRVGGYEFPPFVDASLPQSGATPALVSALNSLDTDYGFHFVLTSPNRRYSDFVRGRFDVIFMEMPRWGWQARGIDFEATAPLLRDHEYYVAAADRAEDRDPFANLQDKRIAGFIGYHYGFAGFNADPAYLRRNYDIRLNTSHRGNIQELLAGRVDIAVVPGAFLEMYFQANPDHRDRLIVSDKSDQEYRLRALLRPDGPITSRELSELLRRLDRAGRIEAVLAPFGLADQWIF